MKPLKIQHGIYKNLPGHTVYNSQAGTIVFALAIAFKLSGAPSIISETYGSSTLWAYIALSVIELLIAFAVFAFVRMQGDDLLRTTGNRFYKICCGVCSLWLTAKGAFYFCYCASYLAHEQFGGAEPSLFHLLLLAPIVFMGIKGIRTISRTSEIFVPVFIALIVLNLVFLETDLDIGRNFPIFSIEPKDFFSGLPRYGLWLGDLLPFIFLRIKNKRMPYLSSGITLSLGLVLTVIFLGVAVYGDALRTVTDLLIRIAGFNQLTMDIGRMEWTNLFAVIALSIISLSFIFYGSVAAAERATGFSLPAKIITSAVIAIVILSAQSSQAVAQFAVGVTGYVMSGFAVALPLLILATALFARRKYAGIYKNLGSEYLPEPPERPDAPDSLADNVLAGMKESAEQSQTIMPNGTLEPQPQEGNK